jgi:hypothetical protein
MQDHSLIDRLIDTYHVLNTSVRTVPEERLRAGTGPNGSIAEIVRRMRDDELKFSQALRERTTGVAMPDIFGSQEAPIIGTEGEQDPTAMLIAQFGSAREVTLALLRSLPEAVWDQSNPGEKSIRASVSELVDNNERQLARIASLLGSPAPA